MTDLAHLVASGGGLGRARLAPGTVASFAALTTGLALRRAGLPVLACAAGLASVAGWFAVRRLPDARQDPSWVVVDEIAGQWIAMLGLPRRPSRAEAAAAFALFRALDIAKPGPVGWADRKPGAAGVMADDLIAGAIAAVALHLSGRIRA